ncbi:hypothetical protein ACTPEM_26465, partial [Clostridioides difficile]
MISFNLGEDIKPIYKVASGGEMSRFMLAFKTILADIDDIDTFHQKILMETPYGFPKGQQIPRHI